jgi:hypothetical protein
VLFGVAACTGTLAPPPVAPTLLEIELLATDPPLPARLAAGDTLYLRLAYRSDQPVRIQARGWRRGEPRPGGFNGSPVWAATRQGDDRAEAGGTPEAGNPVEAGGSAEPVATAEAFAWFFVSEAGAVDQVRVQVGDAAGRVTFAEFPFPVDVQYGAAAPPRTPAPWVAQLRARSDALMAADAPPPSSGPADQLLGMAIIAAIFAVLASALVLPLWAALRWPSPWRWGAWLAVALFALPVLNVVAGVAADPTSHNLWPLELFSFALASLALVGVLALMRRF